MRKHQFICLLGISVCVLVSGCVKERIIPTGSDAATVELSEAAVSINRAVQDLAASDQSEPMKVKKQALNPNAFAMGRLATVEWNGPAEPLIQKIAALTQYRVKVFGKKPALPILVSVAERDQYIGDVLHAVSLQAKDRMKVLIYPSDKLIEMHYLTDAE